MDMNIPNGTYRARAKEWILTEIGEKNTPAVSIEFGFSDPSLGNATIAWDGWLTEKAADRTIESLRYCGWEGLDLTELQGLDRNEVDLVIEAEEYEGRTYPKVKWVNRAGGLSHKVPLTGDRARFFAEQMKLRIRAFDAQAGKRTRSAPSQQSGPPEPPPLSDDDLPF